MSKEKKLTKKKVNTAQQAFEKAVKKNQLINSNDSILVGLSGGIDSLVLLDLLANRKKHFDVEFTLKAVHVDIKNIPYSVNREFLHQFCEKRDIEFLFIEKEIQIDETKMSDNPCFICSWNRRKLLFDFARENNFNKLALGHHKDDAIETFLINLVYHGTISSLPVSLDMFSGRMKLIRPLMYLNKEQIVDYSKAKDYEAKIKTCTFDNKTKRRKIVSVLKEMRKFNPHVDGNIFKAMSDIYEEYLPK
ncbi:MAG: tRNA lysidine(34) synthetase TilS [Bacteroidota bacterium]|nr:tRNA lysidine(34) synthetase TilS [Bacteroidota bacterium]